MSWVSPRVWFAVKWVPGYKCERFCFILPFSHILSFFCVCRFLHFFSITLFCPAVFYLFYIHAYFLLLSQTLIVCPLIVGQVYSRPGNISRLNDHDCGSSGDKARYASACGICILTVRLFSVSCESRCIIHEASSRPWEEYISKCSQNGSERGEIVSWTLKLNISVCIFSDAGDRYCVWCMCIKSVGQRHFNRNNNNKKKTKKKRTHKDTLIEHKAKNKLFLDQSHCVLNYAYKKNS